MISASYPYFGYGGFYSYSFLSSFLGAFFGSFLPPFLAASAYSSFLFLSSYFFFWIQSYTDLVTNFLTVIESSQSWYYYVFCLIWTVSQGIASSLWVIVLEDLKTTVMLFKDFGAIWPVFGINLKSSWAFQLNLTTDAPLFLRENVILFSYSITQSSKFILSYYSRGRFSKRISSK